MKSSRKTFLRLESPLKTRQIGLSFYIKPAKKKKNSNLGCIIFINDLARSSTILFTGVVYLRSQLTNHRSKSVNKPYMQKKQHANRNTKKQP